MAAIGIDLGTTYSRVGYVNYEGIPALFPDRHDANQFRTPSVVHVSPTGCYVGESVEQLLHDSPELPVVRFAKLSLGCAVPVFRDHQQRDWSPEAVCAMIHRKLRKDIESFGHETVDRVILTVPAQFSDVQRRGARAAATLAGLNVMSLVEEPVAAASYLGLNKKNISRQLVYDLGGGTCDVTILETGPQGVSVLATDGDNQTGGKWVDEALIELIAEEYQRRRQVNLRTSALTALRRLAEETKIKLSRPGIDQVRQDVLVGSWPLHLVVRRRNLETIVAPMITKTLEACERCLKSAGLNWSTVDQIQLVGGASHMPLVAQLLRERSGKAEHEVVSRHPHQAVALGAALIAAQVAPPVRQSVATHDLCLRTRDPRTGSLAISRMISQNSILPARTTKVFRTTRSDQNYLLLDVMQLRPDSSTSIGRFSFGPIREPREGYPISVTFEYDCEGFVNITAEDSATGEQMQQTINTVSANNCLLASHDRFLVDSVTLIG